MTKEFLFSREIGLSIDSAGQVWYEFPIIHISVEELSFLTSVRFKVLNAKSELLLYIRKEDIVQFLMDVKDTPLGVHPATLERRIRK